MAILILSNDFFEWIKAIGTLIAALSLVIGLFTLLHNFLWNRKNATFTYLPESTYVVRESAAAKALKEIKFDLYKQKGPIDEAIVDQILDNSDVYSEVKHFLNIFEDYAAAYVARAINPKYAYLSNAGRFIRFYDMFAPLIAKVRSQNTLPGQRTTTQWEHFENVVAEWKVRKEKEIQKTQPSPPDRGDNPVSDIYPPPGRL